MENKMAEIPMADFIHQRGEYIIKNATYFNPAKKTHTILPLHNLLFNYKIELLLEHIKEKLQLSHFEHTRMKRVNMLQLKPKLRDILISFIENKPLDAIDVVKMHIINEPSPIDPNRPSEVGLSTSQPNTQSDARYVDYLYQPANDDSNEKIAMSIFFGHDHIPVRIVM